MEYKEYYINGYLVCENPEEDKFQIFFGFKPDESVRKKLKQLAFRWSPLEQAWQCGHSSNYRINEGKKVLEEMPTKN